MPADHFAVRWSGTIEPRYSEIYTLSLPHIDDTARVLIDGAIVIDYPNAWSPSSGTVALVRGRQHAIVVEYGEAWGWAQIQLAWSSASQPLEVVPSTLDFFLFWKIADAMRDCAFLGTSCTLDPTALGAWSDGVPMVPPTLTIDAAPPCPAGSTAIGCEQR